MLEQGKERNYITKPTGVGTSAKSTTGVWPAASAAQPCFPEARSPDTGTEPQHRVPSPSMALGSPRGLGTQQEAWLHCEALKNTAPWLWITAFPSISAAEFDMCSCSWPYLHSFIFLFDKSDWWGSFFFFLIPLNLFKLKEREREVEKSCNCKRTL